MSRGRGKQPMQIRQTTRGRRALEMAALVGALAGPLAVAACGGGRSGALGGAPAPAPRSSTGPQEFDAVDLFRRMGLLARGAPMPFVGHVAFFASDREDSTHVLMAISIANAALTFAREDDRFRAGYTVGITLRDGPTTVRSIEAHESVLVASFKETSRTDESVLFEEILTVPPGRYDLTVSVRDDGAARTSEDNATLAVPRLGSAGMSTPVSFSRAGLRSRLETLPQVIVNPTASATFGRDSVIPFIIESYGGDDRERQLQYAVRAENGRLIYRDSAALAHRTALHAGTFQVPLSRIGIGAMQLTAWVPGRTDTVRAPLFVGFGPDLPLASFEEMVNYLRWFAAPFRIQQLRDAAPEARPVAWMDFVSQSTDPTTGADGLRDYFNRMIEANTRFREEASPGWMTDRGKVLLGLGRPDQVYEQMGRSFSQQGRQQSWEYRNLNLVLTFYDQNGFGRWRLTQTSESEFMTAWRRRVQ